TVVSCGYLPVVIDITITTQDIANNVHDWQVAEDESCSDHRYIYRYIEGDTSISILRRFKLPKNRIQALTRAFSQALQQKEQALDLCNNQNDLNDHTEQLLDTIRCICDQYLPTRTAKRLQGIAWWTKELRQQRQKCRALRRRLRSTTDEEAKITILAAFRKERAAYKINLLKAKIASWRKFCTENSNPYGILHKLATSKVFKPDHLYAETTNPPSTGNIAEDTATTYLNAAFREDNPEDDTPQQRLTRDCQNVPDTPDDIPFGYHPG
ncbi:uncharacterized protein LOC118199695, partial [Stegodyphus dumicola]|uniref:uncharacterized protein LOC118199695 n=1 Tax=Stegodyphus dumicola TaxID=202533 RepID=UPI0015A7CC6C